MFLSRLNEINGGCEKILSLSGSFWSNLIFFWNDGFYCVVGFCNRSIITLSDRFVCSKSWLELGLLSG